MIEEFFTEEQFEVKRTPKCSICGWPTHFVGANWTCPLYKNEKPQDQWVIPGLVEEERRVTSPIIEE